METARKKWQAKRESNSQPDALEASALPVELLACRKLLAGETVNLPHQKSFIDCDIVT
jgi:hypothetical protein